jgi:hypothetical protein
MLLFTGLSRTAAEIARTQIENLPRRANELHALVRWWMAPSRSCDRGQSTDCSAAC